MKYGRPAKISAQQTPSPLPEDSAIEFDWREIVCVDERNAKMEADRQQQLEDPQAVEWIYLRNRDQQWVARRTPRHMSAAPKSAARRFLDAALDLLPP